MKEKASWDKYGLNLPTKIVSYPVLFIILVLVDIFCIIRKVVKITWTILFVLILWVTLPIWIVLFIVVGVYDRVDYIKKYGSIYFRLFSEVNNKSDR